MPVVENMIATLLTFKPVDASGKRLTLVPTKPVELSKDQLSKLWSTDKIFQSLYKDRAVEVEGWTPPGSVDRARSIPRSMIPPHRAAPNLEMRKPEDKPEPPEQPSTETIEPTPTAGVPGNAKQARASVLASENADQLEAWKQSETRATVLEAIDKTLSRLGGEVQVSEDKPSEED